VSPHSSQENTERERERERERDEYADIYITTSCTVFLSRRQQRQQEEAVSFYTKPS